MLMGLLLTGADFFRMAVALLFPLPPTPAPPDALGVPTASVPRPTGVTAPSGPPLPLPESLEDRTTG